MDKSSVEGKKGWAVKISPGEAVGSSKFKGFHVSSGRENERRGEGYGSGAIRLLEKSSEAVPLKKSLRKKKQGGEGEGKKNGDQRHALYLHITREKKR